MAEGGVLERGNMLLVLGGAELEQEDGTGEDTIGSKMDVSKLHIEHCPGRSIHTIAFVSRDKQPLVCCWSDVDEQCGGEVRCGGTSVAHVAFELANDSFEDFLVLFENDGKCV